MIRRFLPIIILAAGIAAAQLLGIFSPTAKKEVAKRAPPAIEVMPLVSEDLEATIYGNGVVEPADQVALVAQVSGRIVSMSPQAVPGGTLRKGEIFATIDGRDYAAIVAERTAQVRAAEVELMMEQGRQKTAAREWTLLGEHPDANNQTLALREPQLAAAEAALQGAKASLTRAQLDAERTRIRAPFNARVLDKNASPGSVVGPNVVLGTLASMDRSWVRVSLPVEKSRLLSASAETLVTIRQTLSDHTSIVRSGRLMGTAAKVVAQTRQVEVIVAFEEPGDIDENTLPLLPGAYVDVTFKGQTQRDVYRLPHASVEDGDQLWWVRGDDTLARSQVTPLWSDSEFVYAHSDVPADARAVLTQLSNPVEGMKVAPVITERTIGSTARAP